MSIAINHCEEMPFMLSVEQTAELMGVSISTAYALVRQEGFPSVRLGGKRRGRIGIPRDRFIEWLNGEASKPLV